MANSYQSGIIRDFFSEGQPLTVGRGQMIMSLDTKPSSVYYISTGYIKVYSISDDGDEYLHVIYTHGEVFPLIWAYLDIFHDSLFYEAISDCTVWRVSKEAFNSFISSSARASNAMAMQLAKQLSLYSDRLDNLEYKKASDRVVYRLLFLANRFGVRAGRVIRIDAPITHELLAASINLARESVSREFEKLTRQNIVERENHHIIIKDIVKLASMLSTPTNMANWRFMHPNGSNGASF